MTTRQSLRSNGLQLLEDSFDPFISGDGQYVAFGNTSDFVISGYDDDGASAFQLYRKTILQDASSNILLTRGDGTENRGAGGPSEDPSLTDNGKYVVFESDADDLFDSTGAALPGGAFSQIFLMDIETAINDSTGNVYTRVSSTGATAGNGDSEDPVISGPGEFVVFNSAATNLIPTDPNGKIDIFLYQVAPPNDVIRVSTRNGFADNDATGAPNGNSRNPDISDDGTKIAFDSFAANLVAGGTGTRDVYVRVPATDQTLLVSKPDIGSSFAGMPADAASQEPSISGNGQFVAFESDATNLVENDTNGKRDIFVHEIATGKTERVNVASNGSQASGGNSFSPFISDSGRYVAFASDAVNLVPNDLNVATDVFVHDRQTGSTIKVSVDSAGVEGNTDSFDPNSITDNGELVAFLSDATNLVPGDTNNKTDVFVSNEVGSPGGPGDGGTGNPPIPENPRIPDKADWNNNGSNDIVIQSLGSDPSFPDGTILFYDPAGIAAHPGPFDTFAPDTIFATPGWRIVAVGEVNPGSGPEIILFSEAAGSVPSQTILFEPGNTIQYLNPGDANNEFAPLSTPGYTPTTAVDVNGDGRQDIIYRGNDGTEFEGQNIFRDSLTRTFAPLPGDAATTEDEPLTSDVWPDGVREIVFGDPVTGEYRVFRLNGPNANTFGDYFADEDQTAEGQLITGTLNFNQDEGNFGVFQQQNGGLVSGYDPTAGAFNTVFMNVPGYITAS